MSLGNLSTSWTKGNNPGPTTVFCLLIFSTRIRNKKVKRNITISCFLIKNQFMKGCTGHGNQLVFLICNRKEKSALHPWWLSRLMVSLETLSMHHFICKLYLRLICAVQQIMKNHQHFCMIKSAEWNGCLKSKSILFSSETSKSKQNPAIKALEDGIRCI